MIYTFKEQLLIIIYFIIIGMFIGIMFDIINCLFDNNTINFIIQCILWIVVTIICILVVDNICMGYLPFYFLVFFILGYFLYYLFLKIRFMNKLMSFKKYQNIILNWLFPIDIIIYFKKLIKNIKKLIKNKKKD